MKVGAMSYALLLKALMPGDLTLAELAEETGLHYTTVREYTQAMHRAGVAHIARREPDSRGRHNVKIYKLGPGRDAPHIRLTPAQRQQRVRDRRRALNDPRFRLAA